MTPTFKQIIVGQYTNSHGNLSFTTIGLTEDGNVMQFRAGKGWVPIEDQSITSKPRAARSSSDDESAPW